jgi:phospholipid/cholesterol/gamma-HCH transport system substrate-binding protein
VIKTGPSLFFRLDMAISRLLSEQGLSKLLASLNDLARNATGVVDEDNRNTLKQLLKDLSEITRTLATRSEQVDKGLLSATRAAENLAAMTESVNKQLPAVLARVDKSAVALQSMTEELSRTSKTVGTAVTDVQPNLEQFSRETLAETGLLVKELRQLTATLNRVAQEIEREPNTLVLGRGPRPKGPGE